MTEDQAIAPTPELAQHHDIAPPERTRDRDQPAWSIKTRVGTLYERGAIDDADLNACKRFLDDWQCGVEGAREGGRRPRVDNPDQGMCYLDHQVAALSRLRAAEERLTPPTIGLLTCIVVHDLSWPRVCVAIGVRHEHTAKLRGIAAIKALTEFWSEFDRRRSQAP